MGAVDRYHFGIIVGSFIVMGIERVEVSLCPTWPSSFFVSVSCRPVTGLLSLCGTKTLPSSSFFLTTLTARSVTRNETNDDPEMSQSTARMTRRRSQSPIFARFGAKQSRHGRDTRSKIRLRHTVLRQYLERKNRFAKGHQPKCPVQIKD